MQASTVLDERGVPWHLGILLWIHHCSLNLGSEAILQKSDAIATSKVTKRVLTRNKHIKMGYVGKTGYSN